jgi:uncharacterized protein (DUF1501 family)
MRAKTMNSTRREFICRSLGIGAMAAAVERLNIVSAFAQGTEYRALVCIFLAGGNDANNMVVPIDATGYAQYAAVRGASGLAVPQLNLLPITPPALGTPFGLHPNLGAIHPLFASGKLAVVCNVGPLVQPLTRALYQSGAPKPFQLFSHSDQIAQWQTSSSSGPAASGWGGRIADRFSPTSSGFPVMTALGGGIYTRGLTSAPLTVQPAPTALNRVLMLNGFGTTPAEVTRLQTMEHLRTIDLQDTLVAGSSRVMQQAMDVSAALNADPVITTVFPATTLGNQLRQIAKIMKLNQTSPTLGLTRQMFFCQLGGFDTHQNQVGTQGNLFTQLGNAMKAFYDSTVELGLESSVTTFTLSDFGRTFQPSGTGAGVVGTDHAWGSHHFVMGGSLVRSDFFGVPGPNGSVFQTLALSGPDDADSRGRWIPTTSVDQYGATLASWFGVPPSDIPSVFPNIGTFGLENLGFLV